MDLIDTHCHIDIEAFDADREQVLARASGQGVRQLIVPAIDAARWEKLIGLCATRPELFPALGLHPVFLDAHSNEDIAALEHAVATYRPLAVGEIGLDYFMRELDRDRQQALFEAQLEVARNAHLPVILHVRKAHDEVLATLRRIPVQGGTAHAFNGSLQQAQQYIDMGFKLGFGGMLTYPRSTHLRQLARELPVDAIVLETDAPDMTGAAHHGERNSPEYLPDCLHALSGVRDEAPEVLAQQTTDNARAVFALDAGAQPHE
ncbi:MAG TPA: TatD family deoxyribonuclease [Gammaproteobacteria bacterium]|nr:TatD family deoxyribonuclease [Gammaproteobacteria bacterium]